jgi:hypothetical protein
MEMSESLEDKEKVLCIDGKAAKRGDFANLWGIRDAKQAGEFLSELVALNFLGKRGQHYYITEKYHTMGYVLESPFAKVYHTSGRLLAYHVSVEALGLLYKMIPWVNMHNTIVCTNPLEQDPYKIEMLTHDVLSETLAIDSESLTKFIRELINHGVSISSDIGKTKYYKIHPYFVTRMEYEKAMLQVEEFEIYYANLRMMNRKKKNGVEIEPINFSFISVVEDRRKERNVPFDVSILPVSNNRTKKKKETELDRKIREAIEREEKETE